MPQELVARIETLLTGPVPIDSAGHPEHWREGVRAVLVILREATEGTDTGEGLRAALSRIAAWSVRGHNLSSPS